MTVSTTTNRVAYTGDGVSVAFTVPFLFLANSDIDVYVDGAQVTTGFTTTGAAAGSGTVTFSAAPANLAAIVLVRDPDFLQSTALPSNGPFPSTSVERMSDKSMIGLQRLSDLVGRALTIDDGEAVIDMTLPSVADRASRLLAFDATTGKPSASTFTATQVASAIAAAYLGGAATTLDAVAFIQAGTGAVSRTAQAKMREVVSAKDFGAVGDGVTDDTAAIQAAIVAAYGGVLVFTPGSTYKVSVVNIGTTAGLHIIGNGATITSAQEIVVQTNADCSNITIEGLKFVTTNTVGATFFGLFTSLLRNLSNIRFLNCDFTAPLCAVEGIKVDVSALGLTARGILVSGCRFHDMGQMGVEIMNHLHDGTERFSEIRIVDNEFTGLGAASVYGMAISISGAGTGVTIANNTVTDAKDIAIECVGGQSGLTVQGNTIRNCKASCISIFVGQGAGLNPPSRVCVTGNSVQGATGGVFHMVGITDGTISGNVVTGSHKVSLEVLVDVAITGNTFHVTEQILFLTLASCTITGNRCRSLTDVAGYEPTMTACTDCVVTGNAFRSARQNGLVLRGASSYNVISGNILDNSDCTGPVAALNFDGAAVKNNTGFGNTMKVSAAGGFSYAQNNGATLNQVGATLATVLNFRAADQIPAPMTLSAVGSGWQQPVRIGSSYIWSDNTARLRIKASLPTTDLDGTVVGTQT